MFFVAFISTKMNKFSIKSEKQNMDEERAVQQAFKEKKIQENKDNERLEADS